MMVSQQVSVRSKTEQFESIVSIQSKSRKV
uniref:Uncharacterized protein n=1 Tax=Arundo donax TaxID=35708 RepID=A0A0A9FFX0_ARUDO